MPPVTIPLYDQSKRKRACQGRSASDATAVGRGRNCLNRARAVTSTVQKNFNRDEPHLGRDKAKSRAGPRADRIFRARKSRTDHSRRAWSWNRDWIRIRYASSSEEKAEVQVKSPLGNLNWSFLS